MAPSAMAMVWRCPPDMVPTVWRGSEILIPILSICSFVISSIRFVSKIPSAGLLRRAQDDLAPHGLGRFRQHVG